VRACEQSPRIDLERLTGIRERRICGEGQDSRTLAIAGALNCLVRSRYAPDELEMLIFCGITTYVDSLEYQLEPSLSSEIASAIGATRAHTMDISNACAGMLTGALILEDFIQRGVIRRGMVVSGEWISHLAHNAQPNVDGISHPEVASLTVGDSGAAAILERCAPPRGLRSSHFVTLAEHSELCEGRLYARGPGAWMTTDATEIHRISIRDAPELVRETAARAGIEYAKLDHVIAHQTSVRALRAGDRWARAQIGGRGGKFRENLEEFGNTASTSHFLALDRLLEQGRLRRGDSVMLVGFASGLAIGALVFTVDELADAYARPN
jgi:3-oxoacyl-[acyl-carrier-protein] synthase-3